MTRRPDDPSRSPDHVHVPDVPVAIVGVGALFPGSTTTVGFWGDIVAGRDRITEVPATHWRLEDYFDPDPAVPDKIYSRRGAFLPAIDFSPLHFGIPPASLPAIDSVQLLALEIAERVITDIASRAFSRVDRDRIGVILGVASATELVTEMSGRLHGPRWTRELRAAGLAESEVQRVTGAAMDRYVPWQENTFPGLLGNVVAGRIANRLDLGGSNFVVDAACGSSLAAVEAALNELYLNRADLLITGGVDALNGPLMFKCFSQVGALSRSGACRPFSADADGTLLGEGVGMFALKRLADAERDGDHIYAVIRGIGSSSDRRALSIYAPRAEGQAKALARTYARAGYGPEDVELVEAHGTGTRAGDLAEVEGLRQVFGPAPRRGTQWCALGSVKSQIGHTKAASGAAGLFKVAMALHHKVLPPTINVERPDPRLGLEASPFYLNTHARPWIKAPGTPRRASVSAFGFGGTNFHVTLEEYDGVSPRAPRLRAMPSELLLVSAADREGLAEACRDCARRLAATGAALDAITRDTQAAFSAHADQRIALVAADASEAARELERTATDVVAGGAVRRPGLYYGHGDPPGKIAFVFPGQGSQYVGMGADLAMQFEIVRRVWDLAAGFELDPAESVMRSVFPPPALDAEGTDGQERALRATERAQPAIATASFAATTLLRQIGLTPALVAGHSLGEITALATAGAFDLETLFSTAAARGRAMADAAGGRPSTMTAVLASREHVEEILRAHGRGLVIANHNAPEQTVVSGELPAIEVVETALAAAGVTYRRLPVAAAFHSPLFAGAAAALETFLSGRQVEAPAVPVYSHATAAPYGSDVATLPAQLGRAVVSPVRFVEQIEALYRDGARVFIEPGPDNVLTRLVGECLKGREHVAVSVDRRGVDGVTSLWHALGALAAAGVPFDSSPLWEGQVLSTANARDADATTVRINGAHFGKRYPGPDRDGQTAPSVQTTPTAAAPASAPAPISAAAPRVMASASVAPTVITTPAANVAPAGTTGDATAWLEAFAAIQQQTAAAHADFQRLLAERHEAFLRASTEGLRQLAALAGVTPVADAAAFTTTAPFADGTRFDDTPLFVEPATAGRPSGDVADAGEIMPSPVDRVAPPREPDRSVPTIGRDAVPTAPRVAPPVAALPVPTVAPAQSRSDVLLDIVAEKTGYPREALDLGMDLESDLGIDSIKRVEILAAANQRIPDLPRLQAEKLAAMRTLAQIAAYIDRAAGISSPPATAPAAPPATPAPSPAPPRTPSPAHLSSPSPARSETTPSAALDRWVQVMHDAVAPGFAAIDLWDGEPIAIVGGPGDLGRRLAARLTRQGIAAEAIDAPPASTRRIILLGNPVADSVETALAADRRMLTRIASCARAWERDGGLLVTVESGLDRAHYRAAAWLGGLAAVARTARAEMPRLATKSITLDGAFTNDDAIAHAIEAELIAGGPDTEISLTADGRRRAPRLEARAPVSGALGLSPGAVVVVSGGARGITAAAVVALAQRLPLKFLLIGRTPLVDEPEIYRGVTDIAELGRLVLQHAKARGNASSPADVRVTVARIVAAREVADVLTRVRTAGSDVQYVAADITDARAVAEAVETARRAWGPIGGVIHGAGALADAWLRDKTEAHIDRVFGPKLNGFANLLAATATDPLRLLCTFSSVVAHVGNRGQADYAMANSILERVAAAEAARRGPSCHVRALAWGPWDAGMVTPQLREKFASEGVGLIALAAGSTAFVRELERGAAESTVVLTAKAPADGPQVEPSEGAFVVAVTFERYPQLADHRIGNRIVLPMALVVEWIARLLQVVAPDASRLRLDHLQVLRPVFLAEDGASATRFLLKYRRGEGGRTVQVRLCTMDGTACYEGTLLLPLDGRVAPIPSQALDGAGLSTVNGTATTGHTRVYGDGALFHGPRFQMLRGVDGVSATAARAHIATTSAMNWPGAYLAEPVLVDGALQLALVWAFQITGQPHVPMRVGALDVALEARPGAVVTGALVAPPIAGATRRAGVRIADEIGSVLVDVRDIEVHPIPAARSTGPLPAPADVES